MIGKLTRVHTQPAMSLTPEEVGLMLKVIELHEKLTEEAKALSEEIYKTSDTIPTSVQVRLAKITGLVLQSEQLQ